MSNSTIYINGQPRGNEADITTEDGTMDFKTKTEKIYNKNINEINIEINKMLKKELDNMAKYIPLDKNTRIRLVPVTIDYLTDRVKRQIEHRLIIENLYPEEMKEEALSKLPKYILAC